MSRRHHQPPQPPFIWLLDLRTHYYRFHINGRIHSMATGTLKWTNPTTRTDGSPLAASEIAKVDIFDSASPGAPIGSITDGSTTFATGVLTVGDHSFTAVVTDTTGHVSGPSHVATATIAPTVAAPAAISDLAVTINP